MQLKPLKTKFSKAHKGKAINRIINKNSYIQLSNGVIGLKTLMHCRLTGIQIQNLYFTLNKFLKKAGNIKIKVFPSTPVSKKPNEIRMGKGKGAVDHWICRVLPGTILCEIETNNMVKALKAITYVRFRLPVRVKVVKL